VLNRSAGLYSIRSGIAINSAGAVSIWRWIAAAITSLPPSDPSQRSLWRRAYPRLQALLSGPVGFWSHGLAGNFIAGDNKQHKSGEFRRMAPVLFLLPRTRFAPQITSKTFCEGDRSATTSFLHDNCPKLSVYSNDLYRPYVTPISHRDPFRPVWAASPFSIANGNYIMTITMPIAVRCGHDGHNLFSPIGSPVSQ